MTQIKVNYSYIRMGDMDCRSALNVYMQEDGDIIVWIGAPYFSDEEFTKVEFCTVGSGGGRSDYTREALKNLIKAIQKDNEENPIYIDKNKVG